MSNLPAPSVLAVHDLSCVGRCALTVVLPVLAASGLQPIPLPTAALSTHTGGFDHIAVERLTSFMRGALDHWRALEMRFDAVYSGYLADLSQVALVSEIIDWQRADGRTPFVLVDPVLGDEGRLYQGIDASLPDRMRALAKVADLITPNPTEACALTGIPYRASWSRSEAIELITALDSDRRVLTGIKLSSGARANLYYRPGGEVAFCEYDYIPEHYPGAGDLFASVFLAGCLRGERPEDTLVQATRFCSKVIADTYALGQPPRLGLQLERALSDLM